MNLTLAISKFKVLYYKLSSEPINSKSFKKFMKELFNNLTEDEKTNFFFRCLLCIFNI